jgi:hypothetical protein
MDPLIRTIQTARRHSRRDDAVPPAIVRSHREPGRAMPRRSSAPRGWLGRRTLGTPRSSGVAESGHARALSPNAASGRAGSLGRRRVVGGEVRDEEETMSAGTRNSSNALDGGPRRDRYSGVLRNPPFSDFRWYQRPIGRPVPRAIPGAWRHHCQSTLLDSTGSSPSTWCTARRPRACSAIGGVPRDLDLATARRWISLTIPASCCFPGPPE